MMFGAGAAGDGVAILALAGFVGLVLLMVSFVRPKWGLIGLVLCLLIAAGPTAWQHISYKAAMWSKGVSHARDLDGGSYTVALGGDIHVWRDRRSLFDDPWGGLSFVAELDDATRMRLTIVDVVPFEAPYPVPDCDSVAGPHGLAEFIMTACLGSIWMNVAYLAQRADGSQLVITCVRGVLDDDPCTYRQYHAGHWVWVQTAGVPVAEWRRVVDRTAALIDQSFTAIPATP